MYNMNIHEQLISRLFLYMYHFDETLIINTATCIICKSNTIGTFHFNLDTFCRF